MQLIDTHVHINFPEYKGELEQLAQRWRAAGVVQLVHSCVTPEEFPTLQAIAQQFPNEVYLAVGLHPLDVNETTEVQLICEQLNNLVTHPSVVAIGETGLDFFKANNRQAQAQLFEAQIVLAQKHDKALIIHCRDAADACLEILKPYLPLQAVMHCWTGTPAETQRFVELGCYISFSGVVTFKNAHAVHESVKIVPPEQLLIETDCPFLAPVPQRGKRNEPAYVAHVAHRVAELRELSIEALAALTTTNAQRLFQLPCIPLFEESPRPNTGEPKP